MVPDRRPIDYLFCIITGNKFHKSTAAQMKKVLHSNLFIPFLAITALLFIFSCEFPSKVHEEESTIADVEPGSRMPFVLIPAGSFTFGAGANPLKIDYDYEIMKYPVTNFNYTRFLNELLEANKITVENNAVKGFYSGNEYWPAGDYIYLDMGDPECRIGFSGESFYWEKIDGKTLKHHPVVEVTWFGATAFARYYGLRLPKETEWEKAARGSTGYTYPWGNWLDHNRANFWDSGDEFDNGTTPVHYFNGDLGPDTPSVYGVYDMAGNVWEWMSHGERHLAGYRLRGGAWTSKSIIPQNGGEFNLDITVWLSRKGSFSPITSAGDIGFRCVREVAEN
jgi:formylglycine-generating enzyme required for sulfatase activity